MPSGYSSDLRKNSASCSQPIKVTNSTSSLSFCSLWLLCMSHNHFTFLSTQRTLLAVQSDCCFTPWLREVQPHLHPLLHSKRLHVDAQLKFLRQCRHCIPAHDNIHICFNVFCLFLDSSPATDCPQQPFPTKAREEKHLGTRIPKVWPNTFLSCPAGETHSPKDQTVAHPAYGFREQDTPCSEKC